MPPVSGQMVEASNGVLDAATCARMTCDVCTDECERIVIFNNDLLDPTEIIEPSDSRVEETWRTGVVIDLQASLMVGLVHVRTTQAGRIGLKICIICIAASEKPAKAF